jgi:hypothetical protein
MVQRALCPSFPLVLDSRHLYVVSVLLGSAHAQDHGDPILCLFIRDKGQTV